MLNNILNSYTLLKTVTISIHSSFQRENGIYSDKTDYITSIKRNISFRYALEWKQNIRRKITQFRQYILYIYPLLSSLDYLNPQTLQLFEIIYIFFMLHIRYIYYAHTIPFHKTWFIIFFLFREEPRRNLKLLSCTSYAKKASEYNAYLIRCESTIYILKGEFYSFAFIQQLLPW